MPKQRVVEVEEVPSVSIESIDSFQMPNVIIDELMPLLTDEELRVLIYINRHTVGFPRLDGVQFAALPNGCGITNAMALAATSNLIGYSIVKICDDGNYQIRWGEGKIDWLGLNERNAVRKSQ